MTHYAVTVYRVLSCGKVHVSEQTRTTSLAYAVRRMRYLHKSCPNCSVLIWQYDQRNGRYLRKLCYLGRADTPALERIKVEEEKANENLLRFSKTLNAGRPRTSESDPYHNWRD